MQCGGHWREITSHHQDVSWPGGPTQTAPRHPALWLGPGAQCSHLTAPGPHQRAISDRHPQQLGPVGPTPSMSLDSFVRVTCLSRPSAPSARGTSREWHFMLRRELSGRKEPPSGTGGCPALSTVSSNNEDSEPITFPFSTWLPGNPELWFLINQPDSLKKKNPKNCLFFVAMGFSLNV